MVKRLPRCSLTHEALTPLPWSPWRDCAVTFVPTHCQLIEDMLVPLLAVAFLLPCGTSAVAAGYENCPGFRHYFNISEDYDGGVPDSLVTGRPTVVSISYYINRLKFVMEAK